MAEGEQREVWCICHDGNHREDVKDGCNTPLLHKLDKFIKTFHLWFPQSKANMLVLLDMHHMHLLIVQGYAYL